MLFNHSFIQSRNFTSSRIAYDDDTGTKFNDKDEKLNKAVRGARLKESELSYERLQIIKAAKQAKNADKNTKEENRTQKAKRMADEFTKYFGITATVDEILELANMSEVVGIWYSRFNEKYALEFVMPDYVRTKLREIEIINLNSNRERINTIERDFANKVAKEAKDYRARIDDLHETRRADLESVYEDSPYARIFTLRARDLPIKYLLDIIQYKILDRAELKRKPEVINNSDYVSGDSYENQVLETFRKEMFFAVHENAETVDSFMQKAGAISIVS